MGYGSKGGGRLSLSRGLIWPVLLVVMLKRCVIAQRDMQIQGDVGCFLCWRRHKCTEETLVALRQTQINNLSPNDSQVWEGTTAM